MLGQTTIRKTNLQSEEDESLVGLLALAADSSWRAEVASSGAVVLRREDERGQPTGIVMSVCAAAEDMNKGLTYR